MWMCTLYTCCICVRGAFVRAAPQAKLSAMSISERRWDKKKRTEEYVEDGEEKW